MPSSPEPLTPEQICELEKAEKAEREALERGMAWVAAPREVRTEQEQSEYEAAWLDATLDAAGFFAMENITPVQAAMLLCRFSPHDETLRDAETSTTDETTPDDFKRLMVTFEDRAAARPRNRSLLDWMAVAAGAGRKTHPWAARYAKHHGLFGPPEPEESPAPAAPPPVPLVANVNVVNITQPPAPAPEQAPPAPPESAPFANPSPEPEPLTTGDIANVFDGLGGWNEQQWMKPLGDKPKWLRGSVAIPGKQGSHETRWNPVTLGAALIGQRDVAVKSVRARFQTKKQLMPWLDAWKTYEAEYLDNDS